MTDPATSIDSPRRSYPRLKVLYLFAVSAAAFAVPAVEVTRVARWYVVPGLLGLQVLLLLFARVPPRDILRASLRLKWLFAFLIACYVFLPGNPDDGDTLLYWQPLAGVHPIPLNLTGLESATLMCLQILTVILVSAVVRLTGSSTDLVDGLRGFRLPKLLVYSIDTTLALIGGVSRRGMGGGGGGGRGMGGGRGRGREEEVRGQRSEVPEEVSGQRSEGLCPTSDSLPLPLGERVGVRGTSGSEQRVVRQCRSEIRAADSGSQPSALSPPPSSGSPPASHSALRKLLYGDVGFFVEAIERSLERAREQVGREGGRGLDDRLVHDVSVISGIALAMMSFKMFKVLPGLPFLPGWKTLFFYPLYILAAHLTYSRWGGTTAGTIIGVLGYMQGDGRYGALEILKHLVPGLFIDFTWPIVRRMPRAAFVYCALGLVAAIARTSTEFLTMLLVQTRVEAYAFILPTLLSNMVAGTLSGIVTFFVLPAFRRMEPDRSRAAEPLTQSPPIEDAARGGHGRGDGSGGGRGRGMGGGRGGGAAGGQGDGSGRQAERLGNQP